MKRNPFFMPSGFEPQEAIDIIEGAGDNRKRLGRIKGRKKFEGQTLKAGKSRTGLYKVYDILIKARKSMTTTNLKTDQIQYGIDLAKWWGEQHE